MLSQTSKSVISDAVAGLTRAAKPAWAYAYNMQAADVKHNIDSLRA